ncbi:MAG: four helix bundle protein [Bacteroidetes bacterium]|nr:four helix bundle protein [Bacteroidota bacterium]
MENEFDNEKTYTFFRFEDLRIYQKALDYINWVYEATKLFPEQENNDLVPRFNNASRNIALNIAEGSARNKSQFVYYLKMAKSSVRECLVYTTISHNLNYITDIMTDESRNYLIEMTKMIGALISSLQRNNYNKTSSNNSINEEKVEANSY